MIEEMHDPESNLPASALPSWDMMLAHLNGQPCIPPGLSPKDAVRRRKVSFEVLEDRDE
jgi:hypothetical protein